MRPIERPRGFVLITMTLVLLILFILLFSLMTLSEHRTRLVRLNTNRTILGAEARAGLAEASHYLADLSNWLEAPQTIPTAEASLNTGPGAFRRLEVLSATATEVQVRSWAYTKASAGAVAVTRHVDATFRRRGIGFPAAAIFGADSVYMRSNARTDSYDSSRGTYEATTGTDGHVGSNATVNPVTLDANADVQGDVQVRQGSSPDINKNAHYNAIDYQQEPVPMPLLTPSPALSGATSKGNVAASGQAILSPGRYGALTSSAGAEIVLNGGDYIFDSIDLKQNTTLRIINGKVRLFFRGNVAFGSNNQINADATNQDSTTLLLFADSTTTPAPTVLLNSNCDLVGAVYNPQGPVTLESNTQVFGCVTADTVTMRSFGQVHLDHSLLDIDLVADPGGAMRLASWASW